MESEEKPLLLLPRPLIPWRALASKQYQREVDNTIQIQLEINKAILSVLKSQLISKAEDST